MGRLVLACGASGAGKTFWAGKRIAGRRRVLLYDPTGELEHETGDAYMRVHGLRRAALAVKWLSEEKPAAFRVAVKIEPHEADDWLWCLEMLRERRVGRFTLAIDEADEIPYTNEHANGYDRLLRYCRRYTDEVLLVGQRLVGIPMRARTNCWLHAQFETAAWADYQDVKHRYGPEAAEAVRALATGAEHGHVEFGRGARRVRAPGTPAAGRPDRPRADGSRARARDPAPPEAPTT